MRLFLAALWSCLVFVPSAFAYIGPSSGAGAIALVLGVFGTVIMAILAVVWYPLKRVLKKSRRRSQDRQSSGS